MTLSQVRKLWTKQCKHNSRRVFSFLIADTFLVHSTQSNLRVKNGWLYIISVSLTSLLGVERENFASGLHRVHINYRRISLRHNLSRKCRKIVKFVSITHSERNIWNGPIVATAISRVKRKPVLD
jgi:hypothetical protein